MNHGLIEYIFNNAADTHQLHKKAGCSIQPRVLGDVIWAAYLAPTADGPLSHLLDLRQPFVVSVIRKLALLDQYNTKHIRGQTSLANHDSSPSPTNEI